MEGWIKIHRDILNHWIWEDPVYLKAWITIIINVNHENKKVLIEGELIECKRGQSLMSVNTWVKQFGKHWTRQRVRTFFELLKKDSMINIEGLRKTTKVTVCNYDKYQIRQPAKNQQITSKEPTDNPQITTNKKDEEGIKNEKNEEYPFVNPEFLQPFTDWIEYKKARKEDYKNEKSLMALYKKLIRLSSNDPVKAILIVEDSMANNYAGLFELKINGKKSDEVKPAVFQTTLKADAR